MGFENYEKFLDVVNNDLAQIFENQSEYIFCKEGCSLCCEQGEYPTSKLEAEYLKVGYNSLPIEIKELVDKNIAEIKKNNEKIYKCPFLLEKRCCVYKYRTLICRTFGIMTEVDNRLKLPFCYEMGLNYSNVFDEKTNKLSLEKYLAGNFKNVIKPFDIEPETIMEYDLAKELNLDFGERKRMIDWL